MDLSSEQRPWGMACVKEVVDRVSSLGREELWGYIKKASEGYWERLQAKRKLSLRPEDAPGLLQKPLSAAEAWGLLAVAHDLRAEQLDGILTPILAEGESGPEGEAGPAFEVDPKTTSFFVLLRDAVRESPEKYDWLLPEALQVTVTRGEQGACGGSCGEGEARRIAERSGSEGQDEATRRLLSVYAGGVVDEWIRQAATVLQTDGPPANEKLHKIDSLMPIPYTASAEKLGQMLGVSKQAVIKTPWWKLNRKGERENEVGRRREKHAARAEQWQWERSADDDN